MRGAKRASPSKSDMRREGGGVESEIRLFEEDGGWEGRSKGRRSRKKREVQGQPGFLGFKSAEGGEGKE